jgi:hypothetical protein
LPLHDIEPFESIPQGTGERVLDEDREPMPENVVLEAAADKVVA